MQCTDAKCSIASEWQLIILLCTKCFSAEGKNPIEINSAINIHPTSCELISQHTLNNQQTTVFCSLFGVSMKILNTRLLAEMVANTVLVYRSRMPMVMKERQCKRKQK